MSGQSKFIKTALPLLVIVAGFFLMRTLVLSRPEPVKKQREIRGMLVEVIEAEKQERRVGIYGTGTVQPAQEISITPQVSGRIESISPVFKTGGLFKTGEPFFQIETIDYELALERALATLAKMEYELASVESKASIARREWERMPDRNGKKPSALLLYEPQLKDAKANLLSARAAVRQARLDLDRTRLSAPFNCIIRQENIDVGQYVRSGSSVANIAGTDTAEIVIPLSLEDLRWLEVPDLQGEEKGSEAEIQIKIGDETVIRQGHIVRTLGEISEQSRMARVVVEVDDPYGLKNEDRERSPATNLAMGMFVEVNFSGRLLKDVVVLPRRAMRQNNTVWIFDDRNSLAIRPVHIIRREKENVLIGNGLDDNDKIILTYISGAAEGIALRLAENGEAPL